MSRFRPTASASWAKTPPQHQLPATTSQATTCLLVVSAEAITLYEQVLTDRTRILGEDHPTLAPRNDLQAHTGRRAASPRPSPLYEQVLTDSNSYPGRDHRHPGPSRNDLQA